MILIATIYTSFGLLGYISLSFKLNDRNVGYDII